MISEPLMVIENSIVPIAAYATLFGASMDNVALGRQAADLARKAFEGTEPRTWA
jgi:hypothetical protein